MGSCLGLVLLGLTPHVGLDCALIRAVSGSDQMMGSAAPSRPARQPPATPEVDSEKEPERFLENLALAYSGSYLRATRVTE